MIRLAGTVKRLNVEHRTSNIDNLVKSRIFPFFWIPAFAGMTITQIISDIYHSRHAREGGYPVFKKTFYDSINIDDATLYLILKQANHRISKGRFARAMQALSPRVVQSFFKLTEFIIRCWTFNVRCSTFIIIATLSNPELTGLDFFNVLAVRFKFNKRFNSKNAFLIHLRNFLRNSHAINKNILLIINDADRLRIELFEELALLSDIELDDRKMI